MYTGNCLCKKVKYEVHQEITEVDCCHCEACQKAHASAFSMGTTIEMENFRLTKGAENLSQFESSVGKFRVFCKNCGSQIYAHKPENPEVVRLRPATLNTDLNQFKINHIHAENRIEL